MFFKKNFQNKSAWVFSLIPINMATGSLKVVVTLLALSLGATLLEIGIIIAANGLVTIIMSIAWGKISDSYGIRKNFLLIFYFACIPIMFLLGSSTSILLIIVFYSFLAFFTSGIQPISVMYAVEVHEGKNWQTEISKYNTYLNNGVIIGLIVNSLLSFIIPVSWLIYSMSFYCLLSGIIFWKTAKEADLPLERYTFPIVSYQDEENASWSILDYFDIRKLKINIKNLKPLQILFFTCIIHWIGVFSFTVGEVPLMNAIGLPIAIILGISVAENFATVIAFTRIVPKIKINNQKLIPAIMIVRGIVIALWASLTVFFYNPSSYAFIFPLIFSIIFLVCYALIWQPIMCFTLAQAEFDKKGTSQGQLIAVISLANVIGSVLGGFLLQYFGFVIGFIVSGAIAILALPILKRVNIEF
jgi:MFS family permease